AITIKAMDFNTPYFDINAKFDNFNLDPFIVINPQAGAQKKQEVSDKPEFTSKGEVLFKKITQKLYEGNEANMKWSFRGAGNNIRKLNGSFSFNMKNGTIKASELTKNLKKLYNPEKPDIGYKSMSLNGSAQNGVMSLNGVINGEDEVDIYFKGYANMGDGAIDFDIKLTMPAERVPENLKAYLGNENRLDLELKLTGSIERPQYIITSKVIEKVIEKKVEQKKEEIKEQIQKEAEKKLREIFKLGQ
ncbi:MAG: AsmA family protein, partial [bacterium]|nr:AsmA family protein [bacterium]